MSILTYFFVKHKATRKDRAKRSTTPHTDTQRDRTDAAARTPKRRRKSGTSSTSSPMILMRFVARGAVVACRVGPAYLYTYSASLFFQPGRPRGVLTYRLISLSVGRLSRTELGEDLEFTRVGLVGRSVRHIQCDSRPVA